MNKRIYKTAISFAVIFGLSFAQVTMADTSAKLYVTDLIAPYGSTLAQGGTDVPVMKFTLANLSSSTLPVTKIGIKNIGTTTNAEITTAKFQRRNALGNPVLIGTAAFSGINKEAVLMGAPLFNIPMNETRDVEVLVTVAAGATLGSTAIFSLEAGYFDYTTPTPPSLVMGDFPVTGTTYTISPSSPGGAMIQVLNPMTTTYPSASVLILNKGTKYKINWSYTNLPADAFIDKIELWRGVNMVNTIVDFTTVNRTTSYYWTPSTNLVTANNYRFRVYLAKGNPYTPTVIDVDSSDTNFRIQ